MTRTALTFNLGKQIADLALAAHLPSCHAFREAVIAGRRSRPLAGARRLWCVTSVGLRPPGVTHQRTFGVGNGLGKSPVPRIALGW